MPGSRKPGKHAGKRKKRHSPNKLARRASISQDEKTLKPLFDARNRLRKLEAVRHVETTFGMETTSVAVATLAKTPDRSALALVQDKKIASSLKKVISKDNMSLGDIAVKLSRRTGAEIRSDEQLPIVVPPKAKVVKSRLESLGLKLEGEKSARWLAPKNHHAKLILQKANTQTFWSSIDGARESKNRTAVNCSGWSASDSLQVVFNSRSLLARAQDKNDTDILVNMINEIEIEGQHLHTGDLVQLYWELGRGSPNAYWPIPFALVCKNCIRLLPDIEKLVEFSDAQESLRLQTFWYEKTLELLPKTYADSTLELFKSFLAVVFGGQYSPPKLNQQLFDFTYPDPMHLRANVVMRLIFDYIERNCTDKEDIWSAFMSIKSLDPTNLSRLRSKLVKRIDCASNSIASASPDKFQEQAQMLAKDATAILNNGLDSLTSLRTKIFTRAQPLLHPQTRTFSVLLLLLYYLRKMNIILSSNSNHSYSSLYLILGGSPIQIYRECAERISFIIRNHMDSSYYVTPSVYIYLKVLPVLVKKHSPVCCDEPRLLSECNCGKNKCAKHPEEHICSKSDFLFDQISYPINRAPNIPIFRPGDGTGEVFESTGGQAKRLRKSTNNCKDQTKLRNAEGQTLEMFATRYFFSNPSKKKKTTYRPIPICPFCSTNPCNALLCRSLFELAGVGGPTWTKKYLSNGQICSAPPFCTHSDPLFIAKTISTQGFKKIANAFLVAYEASLPTVPCASQAAVSEAADTSQADLERFSLMTLSQLRSECVSNSLPTGGSKQILIDRLCNHLAK